uniref:Tyrosine-protein phosphatase domain-containing protein n=1 Tax=Heligmosomoides polygyrus TaxID=6339 RepID=A0A8L8KBA2_HELPZ
LKEGFQDAIIDEGFADSGRKAIVEAQLFEVSILSNIFKCERDCVLCRETYEDSELKTFIAQKLFKVDGILCDEQARLENLLKFKLNRFSEEMTGWLKDRLVPSISECSSVLYKAASHFNRLKSRDPLYNWYRQPEELSAQIAARISRFAEQMTERVKWSILIEPGKLNCHLMDFNAEFNRLESFFSVNELSPEESAQTAFNSNYLTKARSKLIPCCDVSRVGKDTLFGFRLRARAKPKPNYFFVFHTFIIKLSRLYGFTHLSFFSGTPDFIHANYIRGGPLLNTFICTQAPLRNTQSDFWRMVYQERSRFIIMLCSAMDKHTLGPLDRSPSPNLFFLLECLRIDCS